LAKSEKDSMRLLKKNLQIAIDGPVASGKTIGASLLAKKLNILYVYTGAMYRAVAWIGLNSGLDLKKEKPLASLIKKTKIKLTKPSKKNRVCDVKINGRNVTDDLFSPRIHWGSSQVGVFPLIRKHLVKLQREISQGKPVVMEGRDIGTIVLPKADLKIYMTASLKTRAARRLVDLTRAKVKTSLKKVTKEIKKRDYNDSQRKINPLIVAKDAWFFDTTNLSIKEEIEVILGKLREINLISDQN
jgi:cytidylate kinase